MKNERKEGDIIFNGKTDAIYKVIVVGDPHVGKMELLTRFAPNRFEEKYLPSVGVSILKTSIELRKYNITVNLMFWVIAGQPQFYMLHRPYFNGADGMLLVFDTTRSSTFSNINNWYSSAVKYGLSGIPRILIGNKIDLKDERKIILPMAEHLSEKLNAPYFETSALTGENIKTAFQKIAELVYRERESAVFFADEIELTPTTAETGLLIQHEALKAKLINKTMAKGDIIDLFGVSCQESDPEDPVNHIMKLFSKSPKKQKMKESMRLVVEKTQPPSKIVKITRDTKIAVNNCIAILDNRGEVISYEYPSCIKKTDNEYRKVIEDLLIYTENLEDRIKNIENEKQVLKLVRRKLEYGKRILNDSIGKLTNITNKLLESQLISNSRYENLENTREEGEINGFSDLNNLGKNLNKLERLISDNLPYENSQTPQYCKYCGGDVEDNQIFCRHCGTKVN